MDIRLTKATVEVFFHGSRVASHPRSKVWLRDPVTQPEHMPAEHRKYLSYDADEFTRWANSIGKYTAMVVTCFLQSGKEPEQGYKYCARLTKPNDKYGHHRLEAACERVLSFGSAPNIRTITTILKNGQDKLSPVVTKSETTTKSHGITRGVAYYQKGGDHS